MGCAFSPDSQKLYLGSANHGEIVVYDLKTRSDVDRIDINGNGYDLVSVAEGPACRDRRLSLRGSSVK